MTYLPFVISVSSQTINLPTSPFGEFTIEDPLPTVLELSSNGNVLSHSTRLTEVNQETTDEN